MTTKRYHSPSDQWLFLTMPVVMVRKKLFRVVNALMGALIMALFKQILVVSNAHNPSLHIGNTCYDHKIKQHSDPALKQVQA